LNFLHGALLSNFEIQGELEHRRCKRFYPHVHKGAKHFAVGIAKHTRRERILHNISSDSGIQMHRAAKKRKLSAKGNLSVSFADTENMLNAKPEEHYQMSDKTRQPVPIARYLGEHKDDPAVKV
jgi:hypothetical protein